MEDYKIRLLDEIHELQERINRLEVFILTAEFKKLAWMLKISTKLQLFFMRRYYFWLGQRIDLIISTNEIAEYATRQISTDNIVKPKNKRKNKKTKADE